ncbi:ferredoxin [Leifsonia shinshuensis]|uniref:ferredoxin n=1 Tax=Leifsonia shinshuensis TaxID=150026 RepID=UPI001F511983|nr:ferredoxin [Leifsonia shinshuensis]MCI0155632.1 ferredoxin [Leifsonia shinshuensis]
MSAHHSLHVDWTRCDGRGLCAELLDGTITRDEWGYPFAVGVPASSRSDIPVRDDQLEAAEDAVALCPVLALRLRPRP